MTKHCPNKNLCSKTVSQSELANPKDYPTGWAGQHTKPAICSLASTSATYWQQTRLDWAVSIISIMSQCIKPGSAWLHIDCSTGLTRYPVQLAPILRCPFIQPHLSVLQSQCYFQNSKPASFRPQKSQVYWYSPCQGQQISKLPHGTTNAQQTISTNDKDRELEIAYRENWIQIE